MQWIAIDCVATVWIAIVLIAIDCIATDWIEIDWIAEEGEEGSIRLKSIKLPGR